MNTMAKGWTPRERALLVLCVASLGISIAGYLDLGGSAGADPPRGIGGPITSGDIRNGTIRGPDIRDGGIRSRDVADGGLLARDLGIYTNTNGGGFFVNGAPLNPDTPAHMSCDPGDRIISGGYLNGNPGSIAIGTFYPDISTNNGWFVAANRVGQTGGFVYTFATCFNN